MATSGRTGDVRCPFYKAHQDLSITCESLIPHAVCTRTSFKNKPDFDFHLLNYCCDEDFKWCEVYQAILAKYEE